MSAPRVGDIVLYVDEEGVLELPAIVTAKNKDGSLDITIFGKYEAFCADGITRSDRPMKSHWRPRKAPKPEKAR